MAKFATVSGVTGVAMLALGLGLPKLLEGLPPYVSYGLAGIGAALLLVAFVWSLLNKGAEGEASTTSQTSHGQSSHNIQAQGPVTINHYAQPPAAEPTPPPTSPWDDPNFSLLNLGSGKKPLPDMPLAEVVVRLLELNKDPDEIDNCIRDAVIIRGLKTWGRRPGKAMDRIWEDAWRSGKFAHDKGKIRYRSPDNPHGEHIWNEIHFNRAEIDDWLTPPYQIVVV